MAYTTLKKGSTGNEVKDMQNKLIEAGYGSYLGRTGADGIFGDNTQNAVLRYQQDNGLDSSGVAGEMTLTKLYGTQTADPVEVPSFTYGKENQYQELLDRVTNQAEFQYNPTEDTALQAARKRYLQEGDRVTEDTLAKAAAGTGGRISSAAVTAAKQAGDYYASMLPEVEQQYQDAAYNRYLQALSQDTSALSALSTDRDTEYARYLQQLSIQNQKRENLIALITGTGYDATDQDIAEAGMTRAQADALKNQYAGSKTKSYYGSDRYDNGGLKSAQIKELQAWLGVDADGLYGPNSQAAAKNKTGFSNLADAWAYYQKHKDDQSNSFDGVADKITAKIKSSGMSKEDIRDTILSVVYAGDYKPKYGTPGKDLEEFGKMFGISAASIGRPGYGSNY